MSDVSRRRRGIALLPNVMTTANLFSGFYAIVSVLSANYLHAAAAILIAIIFDSLDGYVARYTKSSSRFGLEYDSLADLISFGLAPGLLIYTWALSGYGRLGWVAAFLFVACGALRLARYNVQASGSDVRYFTGLPIPAAAGLIAATVLLDEYILRLGKEVRPVVILVMIYALAALMVSRFRYGKQLRLPHWRPFELLVGSVLVLVILALFPQMTIFVGFAGYALSGVLDRPWRALLKKIRRPPVVEAEDHRTQ